MADAMEARSTSMSRRQTRRHKSSSSTGPNKKGQRSPSTSSDSQKKFQPQAEGHQALLLTAARLGKSSHEFTWHEVRKMYQKETGRPLTVEELNVIFGTKGLSRKEVHERTHMGSFMEAIEGSLFCKFKLKPEGLNMYEIKNDGNGHSYLSIRGSDGNSSGDVSSSVPINSERTETSNVRSPEEIQIKEIIIPEGDLEKDAPTSDMSKSETDEFATTHHGILSQQTSLHSSITDDEGWASGKESVRRQSPIHIETIDGVDNVVVNSHTFPIPSFEESPHLALPCSPEVDDDEVFEILADDRFSMNNDVSNAIGVDSVDGGVVSLMQYEEDLIEEKLAVDKDTDSIPPSIVLTSSLEAAFEAVVNSFEAAAATKPVIVTDRVKTLPNVLDLESLTNEPIEKKNKASDLQEAERNTSETVMAPPLTPPPIRDLIAKFETPVSPNENRQPLRSPRSSPADASIYARLREEIGEEPSGDHIMGGFGPVPPVRNSKQPSVVSVDGDKTRDGVVFRSSSIHSSIIANETEDLAQFSAEQEAKLKATKEDEEKAFGLKEQSSLTSLEREYFDSRMTNADDLYGELGVKDADGFTPRPSIDPLDTSTLLAAQKATNEDVVEKRSQTAEHSKSSESAVTSSSLTEDVVTVIERKNEVDDEHPVTSDIRKQRTDSIDSDADIPYSLCSEDDAEPITTIENSMKPIVAQPTTSEEVHDHTYAKKSMNKPEQKTLTVSVELDTKAKQGLAVEVSTPLKERIAQLKASAAASSTHAPMARADSVDTNEVAELTLSQDMDAQSLTFRPHSNATNQDGSMRVPRRHVRFMRGCCIVS